MNFTEDKDFNDYVNKYKLLPLQEKKNMIEKEIKEMLVVLESLNKLKGKNAKVLFNREILDTQKNDSTEDDFMEAIFVYINSIKELIADLIEE